LDKHIISVIPKLIRQIVIENYKIHEI
jgi:hypothetical protein